VVTRDRFREFEAAVLEFSDAPSPATLIRYLNASRALEGLDPLPRRRRGEGDPTAAAPKASGISAVDAIRRTDRVDDL
jgi:hypothetical protein